MKMPDHSEVKLAICTLAVQPNAVALQKRVGLDARVLTVLLGLHPERPIRHSWTGIRAELVLCRLGSVLQLLTQWQVVVVAVVIVLLVLYLSFVRSLVK